MTTPANEVTVGRIAGAFGVTGELKCDPTSAGRTAFHAGAALRCVRGERASTVRLTAVRTHGRRLLVRIEGVDDATSATEFANALLFSPRETIALAEGEYLDDDLVGCAVRGKDGARYGAVERVEHYPASDMLIVGTRMIPMVGPIVTEIDLARREIVVDPPAGLLD